MEMMTYFGKLLALLLILFLQEISSFPLLSEANVRDIEKNLVVLEDIHRNQEIIQEENFQNVDLMNMINPITPSPLLGNWLGGERLEVEDSFEEKIQGENAALPPLPLSDLHSFTRRPVTLGYWNWHWRRK